jgi:hypothetical protein
VSVREYVLPPSGISKGKNAMANVGKCPGCEKIVRSVNVEHVEISRGVGQGAWHGASYTCPSCRTVLGVEADPLALRADLVKALKALKTPR